MQRATRNHLFKNSKTTNNQHVDMPFLIECMLHVACCSKKIKYVHKNR